MKASFKWEGLMSRARCWRGRRTDGRSRGRLWSDRERSRSQERCLDWEIGSPVAPWAGALPAAWEGASQVTGAEK